MTHMGMSEHVGYIPNEIAIFRRNGIVWSAKPLGFSGYTKHFQTNPYDLFREVQACASWAFQHPHVLHSLCEGQDSRTIGDGCALHSKERSLAAGSNDRWQNKLG